MDAATLYYIPYFDMAERKGDNQKDQLIVIKVK
jgi:hypothetical protein